MNTVYLSLGSNMGERKLYLDEAISALRLQVDPLLVLSHFYETEPVGYTEQGSFLNCCVFLRTSQSPEELLHICQGIEGSLHRERIVHWGPRTIDIDIILYDELQLVTEELIIPHPRYLERAFVLAPLLDIYQGSFREDFFVALAGIQDQKIRKIIYDESIDR